MKGLSVLLIVAGAGLGVYATSYDGGSAFMNAAVLCLAVGVFLFFVSAFVSSKKKSAMSQVQQMSAESGGSITGPMAGVDVQNMVNLGTSDILRTVMEAHQQSGGDPDALAAALREKFGGEAVVVDGSTQTAFSSGAFGGSGGSSDLLNQLMKLRDTGAITDQQFEEQKQRLIDS